MGGRSRRVTVPKVSLYLAIFLPGVRTDSAATRAVLIHTVVTRSQPVARRTTHSDGRPVTAASDFIARFGGLLGGSGDTGKFFFTLVHSKNIQQYITSYLFHLTFHSLPLVQHSVASPLPP